MPISLALKLIYRVSLVSEQHDRQSPDQFLPAETLVVAPADGAEPNIDGEVEAENTAQEAEDVVYRAFKAGSAFFDLAPGPAFHIGAFGGLKLDGSCASRRLLREVFTRQGDNLLT